MGFLFVVPNYYTLRKTKNISLIMNKLQTKFKKLLALFHDTVYSNFIEREQTQMNDKELADFIFSAIVVIVSVVLLTVVMAIVSIIHYLN